MISKYLQYNQYLNARYKAFFILTNVFKGLGLPILTVPLHKFNLPFTLRNE